MIPAIVVDDVAADRYVVRRRLSRSGAFCPVDEAWDGGRFLDRFFPVEADAPCLPQGDAPCLVLLDLNMPGYSGFETLEELARRLDRLHCGDAVRVMILSSSENPDDLSRANGNPIVRRYIVKPMTDDTVATILDDYAASRPG